MIANAFVMDVVQNAHFFILIYTVSPVAISRKKELKMKLEDFYPAALKEKKANSSELERRFFSN